MAKLSFRFGAMGSSKTAQALIIKHNFEEKGKNVILLKPALEDRDGKKRRGEGHNGKRIAKKEEDNWGQRLTATRIA